jgi:hypothetical protein
LPIFIVSVPDIEDAPFESVTLMLKLEVPCVVGVPEIVTEFELLVPKDSPPGSVPEATVHTNGETPPLAATVAL